LNPFEQQPVTSQMQNAPDHIDDPGRSASDVFHISKAFDA
jgi:hypothetical protein